MLHLPPLPASLLQLPYQSYVNEQHGRKEDKQKGGGGGKKEGGKERENRREKK